VQQLRVSVRQAGTVESNAANILSSLARGLPELSPALCRHDGTFAIAASGPSLPQFVDEIKRERENGRPICAINGAHDFLCDNGLEPDLFLSVDPRETIVPNTKRKNQNTIYLLASRCHPALFDHLSDCKVMLWHSWSYEKECEAFREKGKAAIGGGTTSGLRAINVAYVMGFRKVVLYGMDSCLADDRKTKRFTGEIADKQILDVIVGGKRFWCNPPMAQQANEFQELYSAMPDLTIEAKGDGLIATILQERRKRGLPA